VNDRLLAFGYQLIEIHQQLREDLADLLDRETPTLHQHCLAFCGAVRAHHTSEDTNAFARLAEADPALRPMIELLERDHQQIATLLRNAEELAHRAARHPEAAPTLRGELEGIVAVLESHFAFEERTIVSALNALDPTVGSTVELFGLLAPSDAEASTDHRR